MTADTDADTAPAPPAAAPPAAPPPAPDAPAPGRPAPGPPAPDREEAGDPVGLLPGGPAAAQALRVLGAVLASTTLLSALLYYFGQLHAYWYFLYFGVNYTVMDLTTADFLIRSVDGLFVPLTVTAAVSALGIWAYRPAQGRLSAAVLHRTERVLTGLAAVTAAVALAVAAVAFVRPTTFAAALSLPGVCLAVGVVLASFASRRARRTAERRGRSALPAGVAVVEWGVLFVLVAVGLFWSAGDYSARVGTSRGMQTESLLPVDPDAVLLAGSSLGLGAAGIREIPCGADAAYPFRYEGLKLVFASSSQYLLLPADWVRGGGTAVVVPRSEGLRLEFTAAGAARGGTC